MKAYFVKSSLFFMSLEHSSRSQSLIVGGSVFVPSQPLHPTKDPVNPPQVWGKNCWQHPRPVMQYQADVCPPNSLNIPGASNHGRACLEMPMRLLVLSMTCRRQARDYLTHHACLPPMLVQRPFRNGRTSGSYPCPSSCCTACITTYRMRE